MSSSAPILPNNAEAKGREFTSFQHNMHLTVTKFVFEIAFLKYSDPNSKFHLCSAFPNILLPSWLIAELYCDLLKDERMVIEFLLYVQ